MIGFAFVRSFQRAIKRKSSSSPLSPYSFGAGRKGVALVLSNSLLITPPLWFAKQGENKKPFFFPFFRAKQRGNGFFFFSPPLWGGVISKERKGAKRGEERKPVPSGKKGVASHERKR